MNLKKSGFIHKMRIFYIDYINFIYETPIKAIYGKRGEVFKAS